MQLGSSGLRGGSSRKKSENEQPGSNTQTMPWRTSEGKAFVRSYIYGLLPSALCAWSTMLITAYIAFAMNHTQLDDGILWCSVIGWFVLTFFLPLVEDMSPKQHIAAVVAVGALTIAAFAVTSLPLFVHELWPILPIWWFLDWLYISSSAYNFRKPDFLHR